MTNNNGNEKDKYWGRDPETGRFIAGFKHAPIERAPRPEVLALRELKAAVLTELSPEVIPVWLELLRNDNPKVRLGAVKLAVETIFPKQVLHNIVGKILHEYEDDGRGKIQGFLTALPAFGEFLQWKQLQDRDRADTIIDAEEVEKDKGCPKNQ